MNRTILEFISKRWSLPQWQGRLLLLAMLFSPVLPQVAAAPAMIFFNGNMGTVAGLTTAEINGVRASGFSTVVIFTMGVDANGNFNYDGNICSNGVYVGNPAWSNLLAQCKAAPSSVTRIEMCIGGWTDPSFGNIRTRIAADGTNTTTVLYRNLQALKSALPIDAIDFDTENTYVSGPDSQFGLMCVSTGFKVTLCPYTASSYWQALKNNIGTNCDQVYLQCYDGGAGNNPATWNTYFGGLKVVAGYWDNERDTTFVNNMSVWKNADAIGGFYWPSCTGCVPPTDAGGMKQYGDWIQYTFSSVSQPVAATEIVGGQVTFTASSFVGSGFGYQWQVIKSGVTNNIPGATNLSLTLSNLQLTNTASYLVRATNSSGIFYSSSSSLTVNGAPSAVNNVITKYAAQTGYGYGFPLTPSWTLPANNILLGRFPSATNGNYNLEPQWGTRNVSSLTAGDSLTINTGSSPLCPSTNYVSCGSDGVAGSLVVYTLTNTSAGGYNLTNITVYGGWRDAGRDKQTFTVSYSKVTAPATFISLGSVSYDPPNPLAVHCVTRSMLAPATGFLATNVAALKFDFTSPAAENGWVGYSEITASGVSVSAAIVSDTLPVTAVDVIGSSVNFTAQASGSSLSYQWQKISGGITNDIAGATNSTLALGNLQMSDAASYQLRATNTFGVAYSTPRPLTVNSAPVSVNNIITSYAAQTGFGGSANDFYTTWTVPPGSLISGILPSSVGSGDFSEPAFHQCGTVAVLTDGSFGFLRNVPGNGSSPTQVACGGGAGQSVTYTLTDSASGYTLTNIVVYGGWGDAGRDQQAYTVSYSKVTSPTTFISLGSVNYNPANALAVQCATRTTLKPANGVLATNVAAVKFDFTTAVPENGYCGYSEILLFGTPTPVIATNPTNITFQVAANIMTLGWPADHIGWRLQVQTNSTTQGLGTNWVDVVGATVTNQMTIPISPANGGVFYRMINP